MCLGLRPAMVEDGHTARRPPPAHRGRALGAEGRCPRPLRWAGTGHELICLADRFPGWRFVAVEPSASMLDVCRRKAEERGIAARCELHEGYLESLPPGEAFDAAISLSLLVSQFIHD